VIEDLISVKHTTTYIHNIRSFNFDPVYTSPLLMSQHNEQEFFVESIITHRWSRNRQSTLELHVRWAAEFGHCRIPCLVVIALVAERRGLLSAPPVLALFA
jgi:hypothetical protein